MKKVWIAQLKCPNNHCVCAVAAEIMPEDASGLEATLWSGFEHLVETGKAYRECGICKSTSLHAEVRRTIFNTLAVALPAMEESQRQQMATATFLRESRN